MKAKTASWYLVLGLNAFLFGSFAHAEPCMRDLHSAKLSLISPQSDSRKPESFSISKIKKSFKVSNSTNCVALVEVKVSKAFLNDDPGAGKDLTQSVPLIVLFDHQSKEPNIKVLKLVNYDAATDCGSLELIMLDSKTDQKLFQVKGTAKPCSGGTAIHRIDKKFSIKDGRATISPDDSTAVH
jgi:hypothetical protein